MSDVFCNLIQQIEKYTFFFFFEEDSTIKRYFYLHLCPQKNEYTLRIQTKAENTALFFDNGRTIKSRTEGV